MIWTETATERGGSQPLAYLGKNWTVRCFPKIPNKIDGTFCFWEIIPNCLQKYWDHWASSQLTHLPHPGYYLDQNLRAMISHELQARSKSRPLDPQSKASPNNIIRYCWPHSHARQLWPAPEWYRQTTPVPSTLHCKSARIGPSQGWKGSRIPIKNYSWLKCGSLEWNVSNPKPCSLYCECQIHMSCYS